MTRAGEVVTRPELMRDVWHTNFWTSAKTIDVHLGWVRKKLGDDTRRPTLITTIRGHGLRFELTAPIHAELQPPIALPVEAPGPVVSIAEVQSAS